MIDLFTSPKIWLILKPGSGKTKLILESIDYRIKNNGIKNILILAPLKVLTETWTTEYKKFNFDFNVEIIKTTKATDRLQTKNEPTIYLVNREKLHLFDLKKKTYKIDMFIIDESSIIKDPTTQTYKDIMKLTKNVPVKILATGTPVPEKSLNIFAQINILDPTVFGTLTKFRANYMEVKSVVGVRLIFKDKSDSIERAMEKAKHLIYNKATEITLSNNIPYKIISVTWQLSHTPKILYNLMRKTNRISINDTEIVAINQGVKMAKLQQIISGFIYDNDNNGHFIHLEKIEVLKKLTKEIPENDNVLILIQYKEEIKQILDTFPEAEVFRENTVDKWNDKKIKYLIGNPKSMGYGLNMQFGGATIIWYTVPYSCELFIQTIGRLKRLGQKELVKIYILTETTGIEVSVLTRLKTKIQQQNNVLA